MKAMQVNKADQGPVLILAELKKPEPGLAARVRTSIFRRGAIWSDLGLTLSERKDLIGKCL